jgi:hypothetical protein
MTSAMRRLLAVALSAAAAATGVCGASASAAPHSATPARVCELYGVTINVAELPKAPVSKIFTNAPKWEALVRQVRKVQPLFASSGPRFQRLNVLYASLVAEINAADRTVADKSAAAFERTAKAAAKTAAAVSGEASRLHLVCTVTSGDGSKVTIGG